jgi:hypothetical protein
MPTYTYEACSCESFKQEFPTETIEKNTAIDYRDLIQCGYCESYLKRKITFTGLTWAPTAGGMR